MDNPEKLATQGTQDENKQSKNTTQCVLYATIRKQTQITSLSNVGIQTRGQKQISSLSNVGIQTRGQRQIISLSNVGIQTRDQRIKKRQKQTRLNVDKHRKLTMSKLTSCNAEVNSCALDC